MDTDLSKEDMIYIIESKIKSFNEYLYNYRIDLSLEEFDSMASEKSEHYDKLRSNISTAESKKAALEAKLVEVIASI